MHPLVSWPELWTRPRLRNTSNECFLPNCSMVSCRPLFSERELTPTSQALSLDPERLSTNKFPILAVAHD
jgi:hypothetical protein